LLKEGIIDYSTKWLETFWAYVLTLTYTILSPLSKLIIPIPSEANYVTFPENFLNGFPCDGDISIYYLFSLMPIDVIVKLWSCLLLDFTIVIYTSDPNIYFYIAKALMELLFPLDYQYRIGLIYDLKVLKEVSPCFVCVLKETCSDQSIILETLKQKKAILVDFNKTYHEYVELSKSLKHPREQNIILELETYSTDFKIEVKGIATATLPNYAEFCSLVQFTFYNEIYWTLDLPLFEEAAKNKVEIEKFSLYFMRLYTKSQVLFFEHFNYIEEVIGTKAVMSLFDGISKGGNPNYERVKAMKEKPLSAFIDLESIKMKDEDENYWKTLLPNKESLWKYEFIKKIINDRSIEHIRSKIVQQTPPQKEGTIIEDSSDSVCKAIENKQYAFFGEESIISLFNQSVKENEKWINKKLLRDLSRPQSRKEEQNIFIVNFGNPMSYQRKLFEGLFYLRHGKDPVRAIKKLLESFEYVEDTGTYLTYFPMKLLEDTLNSLSAVELGHIRSSIKNSIIIKDLYNIALKTRKDEIYSKRIKLPFKPTNLKPFRQVLIDKSITLLDFEPFTFQNPDPVIVIQSAFEDLIKLLHEYKNKEEKMFELVGKLPQFELINGHLETFQVLLIIKIE